MGLGRLACDFEVGIGAFGVMSKGSSFDTEDDGVGKISDDFIIF